MAFSCLALLPTRWHCARCVLPLCVALASRKEFSERRIFEAVFSNSLLHAMYSPSRLRTMSVLRTANVQRNGKRHNLRVTTDTGKKTRRARHNKPRPALPFLLPLSYPLQCRYHPYQSTSPYHSPTTTPHETKGTTRACVVGRESTVPREIRKRSTSIQRESSATSLYG